ncbi:MAG: HDOD domain-containing protein [Bacillota bacterium]|jgi:putative nucleotidyltransferase with HDIG domain
MLEKIVSRVKDLPALPAIVTRVIQLTEDPNSTAKDLSEMLSHDQSLTAKVLRLANSAYYGFPRRINTVADAVVLLGFGVIRSLVMAASVYDILEKPVQGYALAPGELWRHSQACAMGSRLIAQRVKYRYLDQAYIGGLLHDIGKVILSEYLKEVYQQVIDRVVQEQISFTEVEVEILGFDHAAVGARVVEEWNLPPELVDCIAYHHRPLQMADNSTLASIVHLSDAICMTMGIGLGIDGMYYPLDSQAVELLKLNTTDIELIMSRLADALVDSNSILA